MLRRSHPSTPQVFSPDRAAPPGPLATDAPADQAPLAAAGDNFARPQSAPIDIFRERPAAPAAGNAVFRRESRGPAACTPYIPGARHNIHTSARSDADSANPTRNDL